MAPRPFVAFGADHLAALVLTGAAAAGVVALVRRAPEGRRARTVRASLAALLLAGAGAHLLATAAEGTLSALDFVPLHLCDFLIFLSAFALVTRNAAASELVYFWTGAGTLLATITPDVAYGFPDRRCLTFFGLHGAVLVAAAALTFGFGLGPRPGGVGRALLWTNAYAAVAATANMLLDTNYMFLRAKPEAPTLLDALGPWPSYLLACEALAAALFAVLYLPFRYRRAGAGNDVA
jgi:hypothetical integral membrane protein (TIGR02206 family)